MTAWGGRCAQEAGYGTESTGMGRTQESPTWSSGTRPSEMSGYWLVRCLAAFLVRLFYRRVEVVGIDQIPARGPLIVAANHHNSLVDPMLLIATVRRPLVILATAPLFRHPMIGPFLRLVGAVPVHRRQEAGDDLARNEAMFSAVNRTLEAGGGIVIFPEGRTQPEPVLLPLRTGAARMLLQAEATAGGTLGVKLIPVGLVFHEPGTFRTGWALVLVGRPVPTDDCIALYQTDPGKAVRQLTDRLAEALRPLIVEAEDRQTLRLLHILEAISREESLEARRDEATRAAWMQQVMRAYRYLSRQEPDGVADFRQQVERYTKELELTGLSGRQLCRSYSVGVVVRYAFREGFSLLLGLPLAVWGIANHVIPYWLTAAAVRWLHRTPEEEATDKVAVGVVLYPLCWIVEGWTAWWFGGGWGLGTFLLSLLPTGFFALTWQERLSRFSREVRTFFEFLRDRDLHRRLLARRRAIMNEMATLARLVPESVLAGEAKDR